MSATKRLKTSHPGLQSIVLVSDEGNGHRECGASLGSTSGVVKCSGVEQDTTVAAWPPQFLEVYQSYVVALEQTIKRCLDTFLIGM